jgi:hypothetical protein
MRQNLIDRLETRGEAPVFPLPDVVLFPHVSLPLHIFEPRYRALVEDALQGDRIIVMAILKPGWEDDYNGSPEVFPVACAGLIEDEARLPDGRLNIRLRGLTRVSIAGFVRRTPYRVATVRVLRDRGGDAGPEVERDMRRLIASCAGLLQETSAQPPAIAIDPGVPFAAAVNALCQSLVLESDVRRGLLEMDDVHARCRALTAVLERRWQEMVLRQAQRGARRGGTIH